MVEKLTMFEVHLDGAQFGPVTADTGTAAENENGEVAGESPTSGGSKLRPALALVGVVLLALGVRRLLKRRSGPEFDIPLEEEPEPVTAEQ